MATAKKNVRKVERIVVDTIEDGVTLELSKDEAEALRFVFQHIGGNPDKGGRKHINAITRALDDAKVKVGRYTVDEKYNSLYFK